MSDFICAKVNDKGDIIPVMFVMGNFHGLLLTPVRRGICFISWHALASLHLTTVHKTAKYAV